MTRKRKPETIVALIKLTPKDVKHAAPEWSLAKCRKWLDEHQVDIEDELYRSAHALLHDLVEEDT